MTESNSINEERDASQLFNEEECEMPWPAYSEVYKFEQKLCKDKNFAFLCKLCINKKIIQASKSSSANLKKHINVNYIHI